MITEVWKACKGYEQFYEVSNLGRVRSIALFSAKWKKVVKRKHPVLKKAEVTYDGYERVLLSLYGNHHHCSVHRLVAQTFIPNDLELPEVNHKDENTRNNCVSNLEWCSRKYNANYGTLPKRISERQINNPALSKVVNQYSLNGVFIATYPSIKEAERITGIDNTMISRVCKGKSKFAKGYLWKYAF